MRNGLARHVKTNIKNTKKQKTCEGECCFTCKYAQTGYFSDTMRCPMHDSQMRKTDWCDLFERRE